MTEVTPELVLRAYAAGYFPMAESRTDPDVMWVDPKRRGIIPLEGFHVGRRLRRTVRMGAFKVTSDRAFAGVLDACGSVRAGRADTWINPKIRALYCELHEMGVAHSLECWQDGALAGGLYGVALGRAFFGESMFSFVTDASKVALVHLVARLRAGGFVLLDTQFITDHLRQFGAIEITREDYRRRLREALAGSADFKALPEEASPHSILQSVTQTS